MSSVAEIESAVIKLPPEDLAAFVSWFDAHRAALALTQASGAPLGARLRLLTREERRTLATRAAEASARHYELHPNDLLPDLVDEAV